MPASASLMYAITRSAKYLRVQALHVSRQLHAPPLLHTPLERHGLWVDRMRLCRGSGAWETDCARNYGITYGPGHWGAQRRT